MAQFTNQAQLTYNNIVKMSNLAVGEIQDVLSINKTAVGNDYTANDTITYSVNIINSGSTDLTGLTLNDNLGAYKFGEVSLTPLLYVPNSLKYFKNNILQSPPVVNYDEKSLTVTNFTVPANGSATFLYETSTNEFSPLDKGSSITNTAELTGNFTSISAFETVDVSDEPELSISKSISPVPVMENGIVTYTFVIQNTGNTAVESGAVITDIFDPILSNLSVYFNDTQWVLGSDFTYNTSTGLFTTTQNRVTVEAASYSQDPTTGIITVTPGISTLTVSGTI